MGRLSSALRERGYRVTLQREIILQALETLSGHVTADAIYGQIRERYPQVNISTVYRTLELIEVAGLASHTHFDDGVAKWHLDQERSHQHLACRHCGREFELDQDVVEPLARELQARYGFQADLPHFAIVGMCRDCAEANGQSGG
ncbi:MAG TPA: Fur family transcriptional regulator [Dehalococcoidia bacterium]|nr:Fur family transcriptional regulator [Dehalococcoidia bacterium]